MPSCYCYIMSGVIVILIVCNTIYEKGISRQLALYYNYIIIPIILNFLLWCLICLNSGEFKELNDTFHSRHILRKNSFKNVIVLGPFSL